MRRRLIELTSRFAIALAAIILFLCLIEGGARVWFWLDRVWNPAPNPYPFVQTASEPLWRYQPNAPLPDPDKALTAGYTFYIDEHGHRVRAPDAATPNTVRIALLGASNLAGFRLSYADSIAGLIESALGEPVLNLSVIGYDSTQGLFTLKRALPQWPNLSVLLVSFGINDARHWPDNPRASRVNRFARLLYHRTAAFHSVGKAFIAWRRRTSDRYLPHTGPESFRSNIGAIARLCRQAGIRPVFMPDPIPYYAELSKRRTEVLTWFDAYPDLLRAPSELELWRALYRAHRENRLDPYFPSMDPAKAHWLQYEKILLSSERSIDINAIVGHSNRTPLEIFQVGVEFPELDERFPDQCHLSREGWEVVLPEILSALREALGDGAGRDAGG